MESTNRLVARTGRWDTRTEGTLLSVARSLWVVGLVAGSVSLGAQESALPSPAPRQPSRAFTPVVCALSDPTCNPPPVPREFRGVWVATVDNIDWPSRRGLSTAAAKRELLTLLDRARASGLNAVILQVRPSGDALYSSTLEPWSEYLTGRQGVAPKPWWDPLKYAVDQAHRRGLELHAWFNPFRARHPSAKGILSSRHIAMRRPGLVKPYGEHLWMDPGEPSIREHSIRVILDVVRRYDIDGVHLDDYFYPYRERDQNGQPISFPDGPSYGRYRSRGGDLDREDWRRNNVDRFVETLSRRIREVKPGVKFGISPFGIWRPGTPGQVTGLDAYAELYADARKWLREGWVDYLSPQLYWPLTQPAQSYPLLLRWWSEQNVHGRHVWPGNYTSRVGEPTRTAWRASEIIAQVAATRAEAGASGNIHFSAKVFLENRDSLVGRLVAQVYGATALVPPSPWMRVPLQAAPRIQVRRAERGALLAHILLPAGTGSPRWWLVQTRTRNGSWQNSLVRGSERDLRIPASADRIAVRALDRAEIEGPVKVIKLRADN